MKNNNTKSKQNNNTTPKSKSHNVKRLRDITIICLTLLFSYLFGIIFGTITLCIGSGYIYFKSRKMWDFPLLSSAVGILAGTVGIIEFMTNFDFNSTNANTQLVLDLMENLSKPVFIFILAVAFLFILAIRFLLMMLVNLIIYKKNKDKWQVEDAKKEQERLEKRYFKSKKHKHKKS